MGQAPACGDTAGHGSLRRGPSTSLQLTAGASHGVVPRVLLLPSTAPTPARGRGEDLGDPRTPASPLRCPCRPGPRPREERAQSTTSEFSGREERSGEQLGALLLWKTGRDGDGGRQEGSWGGRQGGGAAARGTRGPCRLSGPAAGTAVGSPALGSQAEASSHSQPPKRWAGGVTCAPSTNRIGGREEPLGAAPGVLRAAWDAPHGWRGCRVGP